jgi:hypothetical protein
MAINIRPLWGQCPGNAPVAYAVTLEYFMGE